MRNLLDRPSLLSLTAACALAAVMSACAGPAAEPQVRSTSTTSTTSSVAETTTTTSATTTTTTTAATTAGATTTTVTTTTKQATKAPAPTGRIVVIDPGHNGGNASHQAEINRQVPAGRGKTKPCNTTGTATQAGYPEHAFAWDVSLRLRDILAARSITVVMTRDNNTGVGPCVDRRAAIGNQSGAQAVVSIHADGSTAAGAHGFHLAYSSPPLNAAQGEPSLRLARSLRETMVAKGLATSTYTGVDGLSPREDLAGLNLTERPTVLVECGNMRDAGDAATLSSADGRQRFADSIAAGILGFLG